MIRDKYSAVLCAGLALATMSFPAPADPPPWAPAHGWRKKNDPNYVGYTGKKWERDYGILEGKCFAKTVGTVVGGVAGGAVGSQVGSGNTRTVAIIVGTAIGAVIGSKIGGQIDAADRGCVGHAPELAGERKSVNWTNPSTGVAYQLTPTANLTRGNTPCREFEMSTGKKSKKKDRQSAKAVACRTGEGVWELRS
jgi:surface antigen